MTRGKKACLAAAAACSFWGSAPPELRATGEAAAILDRYVEVIGGKAAHARISNRVVKVKLEIAGQGIVIRGSVTSARPNRNYTVMESEVTGKVERGTDGKVVWSNSVTTGPQLVEGEEREDALYQAQVDRLVAWREFHVSAVVVGDGQVEGKACRKVELTPRAAGAQTLCFDKESGLLTGVEAKIRTPAGEVPASIVISQYREVDGVKVPFLTKTKLPGQERITTVEGVTHNADVPDGRFAPPAALVERK